MKFERPIKRSVVAWADQTGYPNDLVSGSPEDEYKSMMSYHIKYISLRVAPPTETQGVKAGDATAFSGLTPKIETLGIGTLCRERDCEWQNERLGGIPKHSGRWRSSG